MNTRIILCSTPDAQKAQEIGHKLVEARLAACVSVLPGMTSIYRWQGKIETTGEALMIIKSSAQRLAELERKLIELHPYDTPEFVALTPDMVNEKYARWLSEMTEP